MSDITVPIKCKKCKLEFMVLLSVEGNEYCERCHIQTLYDRIKKLERKKK